MTTSLYVLTGASRGMGLAIATRLLSRDHTLLCISRQTSAALAEQARQKGAALIQWQQDLAEGTKASLRLAEWLQAQPAGVFTEASLINNAGAIPRISALGDMPSDSLDGLAQALRVGLEAPLQLTAAFLSATRNWSAKRKILNVSSGLGRRAMAAQAAYCAAKAGMDHFTRCLALEEALKPDGAKVCSLAPGVIDTDMQHQLRSADAASFPDKGNFVKLKSAGSLATADDAAAHVLAFLASPDFGDQPVADVRG